MRRIGTCLKCGQTKIVRDHHINGYFGANKDKVVPYCISCDYKAHQKARSLGKCTLSSHDVERLSHNSSKRRSNKSRSLYYESMMKNVYLKIHLNVHVALESLNIVSNFYGDHGQKLYYVDVD